MVPQVVAANRATDFAGVPVRTIGGSVSSPLILYQVEPEFSEEARKAEAAGVDWRGLLRRAWSETTPTD